MLVRFQSAPIPQSPLELLFDRGTMFPDLFWQPLEARTNAFPYVNIADMNDTIHVVAEIPGVPKNDINIHLQNDVLTISGERKRPEEKPEAAHVRREIRYGQFERSFKLPYEVDASKVTAEYSDGVLRIQLPKTEAAKPRSIDIK